MFFSSAEILDRLLITEYELPADLLENYKEAAEDVFTDAVLQRWEFLQI